MSLESLVILMALARIARTGAEPGLYEAWRVAPMTIEQELELRDYFQRVTTRRSLCTLWYEHLLTLELAETHES